MTIMITTIITRLLSFCFVVPVVLQQGHCLPASNGIAARTCSANAHDSHQRFCEISGYGGSLWSSGTVTGILLQPKLLALTTPQSTVEEVACQGN